VQILKRTKFKFGDFATDYAVLREIERVFLAEDFEPVLNCEPKIVTVLFAELVDCLDR
jgi:hypothetical protein